MRVSAAIGLIALLVAGAVVPSNIPIIIICGLCGVDMQMVD